MGLPPRPPVCYFDAGDREELDLENVLHLVRAGIEMKPASIT